MELLGVHGRKTNYLFSLILCVTLVSVFAHRADAQDIEALQLQIQDLLKTVAALQVELTQLQGGSARGDTAASVSFTRNLKLGDRGEDVKNLQILLNKNPQTRVALSGGGSPGNETTYFGQKTKNAVSAFQELHRNSVLTPLGLTQGTGYFGISTREKLLNETQNTISISNTPVENLDTNTPQNQNLVVPNNPAPPTVVFEDFDEVQLQGPSQYVVGPGSQVIVAGIGFTKENNTVHFGDVRTLENISSPTGTSVTFTVPESLPLGRYILTIINEKGTSNESPLIVSDGREPPPVIKSIEPTEGPYGTTITLRGTGFTKENNAVYAGYGVIENLSSDGETIMLQVLPAPEVPELQIGMNFGLDITWPIWFYVLNDNGLSEKPVQFKIKI